MTRHTTHARMTEGEAEAWLHTASLHDAFTQHVTALRAMITQHLAVDEIDARTRSEQRVTP